MNYDNHLNGCVFFASDNRGKGGIEIRHRNNRLVNYEVQAVRMDGNWKLIMLRNGKEALEAKLDIVNHGKLKATARVTDPLGKRVVGDINLWVAETNDTKTPFLQIKPRVHTEPEYRIPV